MSINCLNIFKKMADAVDATNTKIIDHMTNSNVTYDQVCQRKDLTYEYFFIELKKSWGSIINDFVANSEKCWAPVESAIKFSEKVTTASKFPDDQSALNYFLTQTDTFELSTDMKTSLLNFMEIFSENCKCERTQILKYVGRKYLQRYFPAYATNPEVKVYVVEKIQLILDNLLNRVDTIKNPEYSVTVHKLKTTLKSAKEYFKELHPKSDSVILDAVKEQIANIKTADYQGLYAVLLNEMIFKINSIKEQLDLLSRSESVTDKLPAMKSSDLDAGAKELAKNISDGLGLVVSYLETADLTDVKNFFSRVVDDISDKLAGIYSFSVSDELNRLIPADLGSLKEFFVRIISIYYENLHPIIWAQIFKQMVDNFLFDLPHTSDEFFQFVSKYLLLNSGPFILKTLQMVRPFLSAETAAKYNLTKLKYPLMEPNQIDLIMKKIIPNWEMYNVGGNFSASVGHVLMINPVENPNKIFIVKIIKPISIAQSCWEYQTLYNVYPAGSCERTFVQSIIKSNGKEMNVKNEIKNIDLGHKYYTGDYKNTFGYDVNAKLTTLENMPGIINPDCWFALAVTLAPGIPLSELVESNLLQEDTRYRAKLHRCLDLLVYHFFYGIMQAGFYHGDLHAGNIFFSYDRRQMTLIDFGAVGELDVFADDSNTHKLLQIVIMSIFYNFDGVFDQMTNLLNSKCVKEKEFIDKNSSEYKKFRKQLRAYRINNIINNDKQVAQSGKYIHDLNSKQRIQDEKIGTRGSIVAKPTYPVVSDSIYSHLELRRPNREIVVENRTEDILAPFTNVGNTSININIGFPAILEMIIKFYAKSGINIAIKFTELYEFQKAYALLLGVLNKTGYNPYRTGWAIKKAIVQFGNVPFSKPGKIFSLYKDYATESSCYDKLRKEIKKVQSQPKPNPIQFKVNPIYKPKPI